MIMKNIPNVKTLTSYAHFAGGLDLVSPPLSIDPGKCISAMNYECNSLGGYRRIDGYERFDGRIQPSDRAYYYCKCTFSGTVNVGDIVIGETTGARGKVLSVTGNEMIITRVTDGENVTFTDTGDLVNLANHGASNGTVIQFFSRITTTGVEVNRNYYVVNATTNNFQVSATLNGSVIALTNNGSGAITRVFIAESFKVGGVTKGIFTTAPLSNGHPTGIGHATSLHLNANEYRADISPVPGSGVIRGVCMLKGVAYAFRDNVAGTNVDIYRSTSTGWQQITLFKSLPFKNWRANPSLDGVVINQLNSGATAMIKRMVIETEDAEPELVDTSYDSLTIGTGAFTLNVSKNQSYEPLQTVTVTSDADSKCYMRGTVTSYDKTTGVLVVHIATTVLTGTYAQWTVRAETGFNGNYSGRLILANVTGTWTNNAADFIRIGAVNIAVPDGELTQISILPGGNYQFLLHNFAAAADKKMIYGTDSMNRAFEFDGDVYIPIRGPSSIVVDAPTHIATANNQLILSYFGNLSFSADGKPHNFKTTSLGFSSIGMGDTVTGISPQVGGVIAVFCRDSCYQVTYDAQMGGYAKNLISSDLGAIHYGVLNLGGLYSFDDKGIVKIVPSYVFGGFEHDTISRAIQPVINNFREKIVATAVFKSKNQCRFFAKDGSGICMTLANGANGTEHHFTEFKYPISVSYAWNGEDASGRDIVLIGDYNGYVYVVGRGSSFDGQEIESYLRTAFNNLKSPSAIKRFRKIEVEMSSIGYSELRLYPDFSYADPNVATHIMRYKDVQGSGGYWDESEYNTFYYDGRIISQPEIRVFGSGINIGLVVYSKSAIDLGHTLSGVVLHYTPRKLNR